MFALYDLIAIADLKSSRIDLNMSANLLNYTFLTRCTDDSDQNSKVVIVHFLFRQRSHDLIR